MTDTLQSLKDETTSILGLTGIDKRIVEGAIGLAFTRGKLSQADIAENKFSTSN